jgi:hypothetical protein
VECKAGQATGVALTIAMIPALSASGSLSQRSIKSAKSADFLAKSAKQDAKTPSGACPSKSQELEAQKVASEDLLRPRWF